jgi:protein-disulfide isomerase
MIKPVQKWRWPGSPEAWVLVVTVAAVIVVFALLADQWTRDARSGDRPPTSGEVRDLPTQPLSLIGAATKGSRTAKVAIIEFSDFQCPYCGVFARNTLPLLDRDFIQPGRVLFAFRNLPLTEIHPFAQRAAEGAACAGQQGKFWEMHDSLFGDPRHLDQGSILRRADALELRASAFAVCLEGNAATAIQQDEAAAQALAIDGTPIFYLGVLLADGRLNVLNVLAGAQPISQFEGALDGLLGPLSPKTRR